MSGTGCGIEYAKALKIETAIGEVRLELTLMERLIALNGVNKGEISSALADLRTSVNRLFSAVESAENSL